jgi:hypothetical protein
MWKILERLPASKGEFYWEATDEPHASRRKEILGNFPIIKMSTFTN